MDYPERDSERESTTTIRISKGLKDALARYLKTEDAKDRGLDSQTELVNEAVRHLLQRYGFLRIYFDEQRLEADSDE